jgi:hypothetical protein
MNIPGSTEKIERTSVMIADGIVENRTGNLQKIMEAMWLAIIGLVERRFG